LMSLGLFVWASLLRGPFPPSPYLLPGSSFVFFGFSLLRHPPAVSISAFFFLKPKSFPFLNMSPLMEYGPGCMTGLPFWSISLACFSGRGVPPPPHPCFDVAQGIFFPIYFFFFFVWGVFLPLVRPPPLLFFFPPLRDFVSMCSTQLKQVPFIVGTFFPFLCCKLFFFFPFSCFQVRTILSRFLFPPSGCN